MLYRNYGACLLPHVQRYRWFFAAAFRKRNRRFDCPYRFLADFCRSKPCNPQSCNRRNFQRCRKCLKFSADCRYFVFLPVTHGRQRLHCPGCIFYGQASEKNRAFRTEHRTYVNRLRLYSSCRNVNKNFTVKPGQKNDNSSYAVYELHGKTSDLRFFCKRIFSAARRIDYDRTLSLRNHNRHSDYAAF